MNSSTLIISTYNWLPALSLCLKSCIHQSVLPSEIIIADDGSHNDTGEYIQWFTTQTTIPVKHIWQPDEGFQLARIRNKAIAAASHDYIIQIDGDLVLQKDFIKDHLNFKKQGFFTTGSRMLLSEEATNNIFTTSSIDINNLTTGNKNFFNSLRFPLLQHLLASNYKNKGRHKYYVKGCNMAFWKKDLLKVNGYNEAFTGWGREDSELAIRLINADIKKRFLKFGAVSFHLYHKEASRHMEEKNIRLMNEAIEKKISWAEKGITQYL